MLPIECSAFDRKDSSHRLSGTVFIRGPRGVGGKIS